MALDTLIARANEGESNDPIAGIDSPDGFIGAAVLTDKLGELIDENNPLPVNITGLVAAILAYTRAEDTAHTSGDSGVPILGIRRDADTSTADDGDYTNLKMDEEGRLKVSSKPASYAAVAGDISALNGQLAINCTRVSNLMVQMFVPSAVAGHNVSFEGSLNSTDGTDGNWFSIQAVRSNENRIENTTGALSGTPAYGWECSVNGLKWFRIRANAHSSGVASWVIQPAPFATEPIPAAQAAGTQNIDQAGFSASGASVLDIFFNAPIVGAGVTYNQTSGALNIVAGTTPNAEFLARSVRSYTGSMRLRSSHILSNRIANNNFALLLADLLIAGATYNIVNPTTVDVNWPAHGYTSEMVGQFVLLGGLTVTTGSAGVPGRYAIASIPDADTLRFTVAAWPASGTGTLTLFGRNYVRNLFTGTTVTNVNFDAQRNGWASGDTVATINTTATPGTVLMNELTGREVWLADKLRASSTAPQILTRAFRDENIPDPTIPLFVFLWSFNGSTAPASSTTWTLGHCSVEVFANRSVYVQGYRANGQVNPAGVSVTNTPNVSVTNNPTLGAGTNLMGDVGLQSRTNATGAIPPTNYTSPATAAGFSVKGSGGRLGLSRLKNYAAADRFLKFFNATSVTPGTTSALFEVRLQPGDVFLLETDIGMAFTTGIQIMVTAAAGLTNNLSTGLAVGDVSGYLGAT